MVFANERGKPAHAARRPSHSRSSLADADAPARAPAHVRDPPARRWRRPPRRAGDVGSLRRGDHAALHSRQQRASAICLPEESPTRMSIVPDDPDLAMHWTRWLNRKNAASRDHLIVHYSPLVKFVAGRIGAGLPNSVDPGDLVSSGVFGLIDAIDRFDPERGVKFETFAAPRIRGAIYDGLAPTRLGAAIGAQPSPRGRACVLAARARARSGPDRRGARRPAAHRRGRTRPLAGVDRGHHDRSARPGGRGRLRTGSGRVAGHRASRRGDRRSRAARHHEGPRSSSSPSARSSCCRCTTTRV